MTKLKYYNAVIKTKLTYALETMQLTQAQLRSLDTFQLRGLRNILKLKTTYVDRENTNKRVIKAAEKILYPDNGKNRRTPKKLGKVSTQVKRAQQTLLAHTLREEDHKLTRKVTFHSGSAKAKIPSTKRVGRPRKHWTIQQSRRAWKRIRKHIAGFEHTRYKKRSKTMQTWLHTAAIMRII